jgi:phage-related minor tail protein/SLT domain-containing protein
VAKDRELANLKVALDLQGTATFKQNIAALNRETKVYDSAIAAMTAGTDKFERSLEDLNKISTETAKKYTAQGKKVDELKREYERLSAEFGKNSKEAQNMEIRYNKSVAQMNKTKMALDSVNKSIQEQSSEFKKVAADSDKAISSIADDLKVLESKYKTTAAGAAKLGEESEHLYAQSKHLEQVLSLEGKAIAALEAKYKAAAREKGEDAKETKQAAIELNNFIARAKKTETTLQQLNSDIDKSKQSFSLFGREVHTSSEALENAKEHAKGLGSGLAAGIGAGAAAASVGLIKVAADAEGSQKKLQAQLGLTSEESKKVAATARTIWKDGFGENMDEVRNALVQVKQNIRGLSEGELEQVTKDSMVLADVWGADVNEVTRAGGNLIKGFGISSKEAFDLMAHGAQNGLNFSNEMFDNLSEYGPLFSKMGFSADEYFQLLEQGSEAGVYNLDYINDAMKEFQIRAKDGSKSTSDAMAGLSESTRKVWKDYEAGKTTVKDLHNTVIAELKGMDDQTKANQIGVGLYGTKWEDLEADAMYAMGNIDGSLKGVDGSMATASKSMETMGTRFKQLFREFIDAVTPAGEVLLSVAERWMPKVEAAIQAVADKFNNLSPSMQNAVVIGGLLTAAVIPLIAMFGGMAAAVGPLLPLLGGGAGLAGMAGVAAGGAGMLTGALGAILGPAALVIGTVAAVGAGMYAFDKAMDQPIMKSKIFSDSISQSTQKALTSYMNLDKNARNSLNQLAWGQQEITANMATNLLGQYDKLFNSLNSKIDQNHTQQVEKTKKLFATNAGLTAEEEAKVLANMEKNNEAKKKKVQGYEDRIKEIINTAKKEHRSIRESEEKEINDIQNRMREEAVKTISKSAAEQKQILGALKHESSKLTAEQAAEVVKNSKTQRDKSVENAQSQYKKSVEQIRYMRDVTGDLTAEQAKKAIKNAQKQRDDSVKAANDMHKKVVKAAKEQAKGHADEIDWERGEVKDGYDKMMDYVDKFVGWAKGLFGVKSSKKKTSTAGNKPVSKTLKNNGQGRATGTPNGAIPFDQVALTGEEGPELMKDGRTGALGIVGANGPQYSFLSKGSAVLPAHHTARVLKKYGIKGGVDGLPAYAEGADLDAFDFLMKGPEKLWDYAASKFNISDNLVPSWLSNLTGSVTGFVGDQAKGWLKSLMDDFGFGEGGAAPNIKGGAKAWRPMILKAAAAMNEQVTAAQVNGIIAQIQRESGGNQKIVQSAAVRDINTRNGNPARGLLQYIPQTFAAYRVKGHGNIYSGYDQLLAFFNNTKWRQNLPYGRRGWGPTGRRKYAEGGLVDSHQVAELGENGYNEYVITTEPRYRNRSLALLQNLMKELGVFNPIPKVKEDTSSSNAGSVTKSETVQPVNIENHFHIAYAGLPDKDSVAKFMKYMQDLAAEQEEQQLRSRGIRRKGF